MLSTTVQGFVNVTEIARQKELKAAKKAAKQTGVGGGGTKCKLLSVPRADRV
mgnify:CR=1 FL=1